MRQVVAQAEARQEQEASRVEALERRTREERQAFEELVRADAEQRILLAEEQAQQDVERCAWWSGLLALGSFVEQLQRVVEREWWGGRSRLPLQRLVSHKRISNNSLLAG